MLMPHFAFKLPNRRQFEEFEVKTSAVETMLSSRLMPGGKIGKRMGWVVIGECEGGGDTEVIVEILSSFGC